MRLPDFLIIGAQKAGSTWLAKRLNLHPEIFIPDNELHFFNRRSNLSKGLEWYSSHFEQASNAKCVGEKTPNYLFANMTGVLGHDDKTHHHIGRALPNAKLVVVLRNPVERAVSAVNHFIRTGRISPLVDINDLLLGKSRFLSDRYGVLEGGNYACQISSFLEYYTTDQMLILIFEEDIVVHPEDALMRVCDFLGVSNTFTFPDLQGRSNSFRGCRPRLILDYYLPSLRRVTPFLDIFFPSVKVRPNHETLNMLYKYYDQEMKAVYELLGRDIPAWEG